VPCSGAEEPWVCSGAGPLSEPVGKPPWKPAIELDDCCAFLDIHQMVLRRFLLLWGCMDTAKPLTNYDLCKGVQFLAKLLDLPISANRRDRPKKLPALRHR
jgi:hypothetical protein